MFVTDDEIFGAIAKSGARVLLLGRRAMIALGIPVLTADYDLWVHIDDVEKLNQAFAALDFVPNFEPEEARTRGRYVLEDGQHVDVLVARSQSTRDASVRLSFEEAWARRQTVGYADSTKVALPSVADLITTKRWAMREKDVADIHLLESLQREQGTEP